MKYYYAEMISPYDDELYSCVCSSESELKKDDIVVVDFCDRFVTAKIKEPCDELKIHTGRIDYHPAVTKVDVKEYIAAKQAKIDRAMILAQMESLSKEVKLVEQMKKLSGADPRMKELMDKYSSLG